jgi:peptidoglycan DL-endopeptidase CwlO
MYLVGILAVLMGTVLLVPDKGRAHSPGEIAAEYALDNVGARYQWGGTGNGVFDCSGLTSSAWSEANVTIPRVSTDQYKGTQRVSRDQLRAGDLVFSAYGRKGSGSVDHVAVYVGDGKVVTASKSNNAVIVRELDRKTAVVAFGRPNA